MKRVWISVLVTSVIILLTGSLYWVTSAENPSGTAQGTEAISASQTNFSPSQLLFSYQGQLLDGTNPAPPQNIAMIFRLFSTNSGGVACWTESRTVSIGDNGLFNVLLGQITAINPDCLTGDVYLELEVNGITLNPRERFTSGIHSYEATTLVAGAITRGALNIAGNLTMQDSDTPGLYYNPTNNSQWRTFITGSDNFAVARYDTGASTWQNLFRIHPLGHAVLVSGTLTISRPDESYLRWDDTTTNNLWQAVMRRDPNRLTFDYYRAATNTWMPDRLTLSSAGDVSIAGNLSIGGTCRVTAVPAEDNTLASLDPTCMAGSITSGAYIEANLMSIAERQANEVNRFSQGDLLCWSQQERQLVLCHQMNDPLVMGVADASGKPIVLGAEPIKVIGPVETGDYLVASDTPGYAIATKTPTFGIVIAQALEAFDGETGLIWAMIRKM